MAQYASNYGEPFLAKNHSTLLYLGGSAVQELLLLVKPSFVHQCCKSSTLLYTHVHQYLEILTYSSGSLTIFRAHSLLSYLCSAMYTTPYPPLPNFSFRV